MSDDFLQWIVTARPGSSITYYTGNLAAHRGDIEVVPARGIVTAGILAARVALRYSDSGHLCLVQRAHGPINDKGAHHHFEYIAQRTHKPFKAEPSEA